MESMEPRCLLATFTVTNPNDGTGESGTLREAIIMANETPNENDTIEFDIPDIGPGQSVRIQLASELPEITDTLSINGRSQTDTTGQIAQVIIDGSDPDSPSMLVGDVFRFVDGSFGSEVRGLSITNFSNTAITFVERFSIFLGDDDADDNLVVDTIIGGEVASNGEVIGQTLPANLGILLSNSSRNRIGTLSNSEPNLPSNQQGNRFVQVRDGISVVGDSIDNLILYNQVQLASGLGNRLGIDLSGDGVTPNDPIPDGDTGPNLLQNFPVIQSAVTTFLGGVYTTQITGELRSTPNQDFIIQLYENTSSLLDDQRPGERYLADIEVSTDATGIATFSFSPPSSTDPNSIANIQGTVTATATGPAVADGLVFGNTSEFSAPFEVDFITDLVDLQVFANPSATLVPVGREFTIDVNMINSNANFAANFARLRASFPNSAIVQNVEILSTSTLDPVNDISITPNPVQGPVVTVLADGQTDDSGNEIDFPGGENVVVRFTIVPTVVEPFTVGFTIDGSINDNDLSNNTDFETVTVFAEPFVSQLSYSSNIFTVSESGSFATITVNRGEVLNGEVTVDYVASSGTATEDIDFGMTAGTLTFSEGVETQQFTIPIIDNNTFQANRTVQLALSNPTVTDPEPGLIEDAVLVRSATAVLTIFDNDPPQPAPQTVEFTTSDLTVFENEGEAVLTLERSADNGNVSIPFETISGTAIGGVDFVETMGIAQFESGSLETTISIPLIDDMIELQPERSFSVRIGAGIGAIVGELDEATVTIIDDDTPPEGFLSFEIAAITVSESSGTTEITVVRQGGSGTATVGLGITGGNAIPGQDFEPIPNTLEFGPDDTEQTFNFTTIDDDVFNGTRTVTLGLTAFGDSEIKDPGSLTITILDDDPAPPAIATLDAESITISETIGMLTVNINRSGNLSGEVSIGIGTSPGSAIPGVDYETLITRVFFADGEPLQTVNIPIIDDNEIGTPVTFGIFLGAPIGMIPGEINSTAVSIVSDEVDFTAPTVLDVRLDPPSGSLVSGATLTFSEMMDPVSSTSLANYSVIGLGRDGVFGTPDDVPIALAGVVPVPGTTSLSLLFSGPADASNGIAIGVNGLDGGLTDPSGNLLDGNRDGFAGGHYSTIIERGHLISYLDLDGDLVFLGLAGPGTLEVVQDPIREVEVVRILDASVGVTILQGIVNQGPGGTGTTTIGRIEGLDPFGRVRSELQTPPFFVGTMVIVTPAITPLLG